MNYDSIYFNLYHQVDSYRLKYPDENIIRFLVGNYPINGRKNKKILDLGCGTGRHLVLLNELGFKAFGIDGSSVALEYAKKLISNKKFKAELTKGLITKLPYRNNYFDGIIEHATLVNCYWNDILEACQECHRVLKKGGYGFFLLKNINDCAFQDAKLVGTNEYLVKDTIYLSKKVKSLNLSLMFHAFTRAEIKKMFNNFSRIKIHTWDMSFKSLDVNYDPNDRKTSYFIVVVQK